MSHPTQQPRSLSGIANARVIWISTLLCLALSLAFSLQTAAAGEGVAPNLVIDADDIAAMRSAVRVPGRFRNAFEEKRQSVDRRIQQAIDVPVPADAGGGYTHERHKENYQLMYDAGVIYQLTQDPRYAHFVRDMLLVYAQLYPQLPLHPKRRPGSENPGRLFWQSLNEAVWLVYTIQAYDLVRNSLADDARSKIEQGILRPVAKFLSEDSPKTFNKVHNHGTWLNAAVGMTGYVLDEQEWVEKALLDLDKSGKGGFLRQLNVLFSPDGYYNEGPYYQRYALMPFVTFAKAIDNNEPERKIFQYRDGILLKAIDTTIQLSYNKRFFPINDAIKNKGIDTPELVLGVAIAYGKNADPALLDIARQQDQILLTGDGLKVARALDNGQQQPYQFRSAAFADGADGQQGALVVMRQKIGGEQAVVFKPTAQGLGHGHFDKLSWQFYDKQQEIVSDYGAARFLNVEAKNGGRYLPENKSYAKQTVAHNTVVVDEKSHFDGNLKTGNRNHPELLFFEDSDQVKISAAKIDTAYPGVVLTRTLALLKFPDAEKSLVVDLFKVSSGKRHQFDLPLHYQGQLVDTNFTLAANTSSLEALGKDNGYQHLWLKAQSKPKKGLAQVTWLNPNGRFYTHSSVMDGETQVLFTELGANDPNFNLRSEKAFIARKRASKSHTFVSVLEPHGEYNPAKEYTVKAESQISEIHHQTNNDIDIVEIKFKDGSTQLLAFQSVPGNFKGKEHRFEYQGKPYVFEGRAQLLEVSQ